MDAWERVEFIIEKEGLNKNSFSKVIGIANNVTITRIINEHRTPSRATCEKIVSAFPAYNLEWLLTGEGSMFNQPQSVENIEISKNMTLSGEKKQSDMIRGYITYLLPMSAMGGSLTGFSVPGAMLQNCEAIVSPIENVDFAITVYGDSMAPEYPSGSRILIKKINTNIFIDWGKVFVLDTPNGVIVKEVHESNMEGYISCHSINPDPKFKPFEVPMNEIFGMYRVLMCLSAK